MLSPKHSLALLLAGSVALFSTAHATPPSPGQEQAPPQPLFDSRHGRPVDPWAPQPPSQHPEPQEHDKRDSTPRLPISRQLFHTLHTVSALVDNSYCLSSHPVIPGVPGLETGCTGIFHPFSCLSRCQEFEDEGVELVTSWSTGLVLGDSVGFVAVRHERKEGEGEGEGEGKEDSGNEGEDEDVEREGVIYVAFRGTYSLANTLLDLSTQPQAYVPYPGDPDDDEGAGQHRSRLGRLWDRIRHPLRPHSQAALNPYNDREHKKCDNCTVHSGFLTSWQLSRKILIPLLTQMHQQHPTYRLQLVGHSLGGAVAALAGLELQLKGLEPHVVTFGEPRLGNGEFAGYFDWAFGLDHDALDESTQRYFRVTHLNDPVPLLPPSVALPFGAGYEYAPHGGEVFISSSSLPTTWESVNHCHGAYDRDCSHGSEVDGTLLETLYSQARTYREARSRREAGKRQWGNPEAVIETLWSTSSLAAHRDYFWRLGLCVPGGDPVNWGWGYDGENGTCTGGIEEEGKVQNEGELAGEVEGARKAEDL